MGWFKVGDLVLSEYGIGEITDYVDFFGISDHYSVRTRINGIVNRIGIFHASELRKIDVKQAEKYKKLHKI